MRGAEANILVASSLFMAAKPFSSPPLPFHPILLFCWKDKGGATAVIGSVSTFATLVTRMSRSRWGRVGVLYVGPCCYSGSARPTPSVVQPALSQKAGSEYTAAPRQGRAACMCWSRGDAWTVELRCFGHGSGGRVRRLAEVNRRSVGGGFRVAQGSRLGAMARYDGGGRRCGGEMAKWARGRGAGGGMGRDVSLRCCSSARKGGRLLRRSRTGSGSTASERLHHQSRTASVHRVGGGR